MSDPDRRDPPHDSLDDVLELYKRDVDRSLLRENLKLTPHERIRRLMKFLELARHLRDAGRRTN